MGACSMLSDELARRLSEMPFREDAERRVSFIPLGSIYWSDEVSERIDDLFEPDNEARLAPLVRLFTIRATLWTGAELSNDDRAFWEAAMAQAPDYALFHRLEVSAEDIAAQVDVMSAAHGFWHDFFDEDESAAEDNDEEVEILSEHDIVENAALMDH